MANSFVITLFVLSKKRIILSEVISRINDTLWNYNPIFKIHLPYEYLKQTRSKQMFIQNNVSMHV